jgi:Mlc titration factor MtfA (ptsG expression regulator)
MYYTIGSVAVVAALVGWRIGVVRRRITRRTRLLHQSLPAAWNVILEKNTPIYHRLPDALKQQLHGLIHVFLDEKTFVGCGGLEITDEIKVTIAAQACMLLLNRKTSFYAKLKTIYVYPQTYVAKSVEHNDGLVTEGPSIRLGESWQNGPVVLAWDSIAGGARNMEDGRNVVFHEFAHQLDQEDGDADGAPILDGRSCYRSWAAVLGDEYNRLRHRQHGQQRSVIDHYGATNPAEFFAVATETFFEMPKQMHKYSPDLYAELKRYYKLDPINWNQ